MLHISAESSKEKLLTKNPTQFQLLTPKGHNLGVIPKYCSMGFVITTPQIVQDINLSISTKHSFLSGTDGTIMGPQLSLLSWDFPVQSPSVKTILRFDLREGNNSQEMGHHIQILASAANCRGIKRDFHYSSSVAGERSQCHGIYLSVSVKEITSSPVFYQKAIFQN